MSLPSLRDQLAALGARLTSLQGAEVVETYGSLAGEWRALTQDVALIDLSALGRTGIRGRDAQDYLHRQTSQAIGSLDVGRGTHAVLMNGQGKLHAEMILHRVREQEFLALTMPSCAESLAAVLDRFIFSEDCRVEREGLDRGMLTVLGPRSAVLMRRWIGWPSQEPGEFDCRVAEIEGIECVVARTGLAGVDGYHVLAEAHRLPRLWQALTALGAAPVGWDVVNRRRIEAGIPLFGFDHDSEWVPNDAGLERTLDFTKGCFPGQEVVAKIKNLSHPRQVLRGFLFSGEAPPPGMPLFEEVEQVGTVTSSCISPRLGRATGLGHLKWRFKGVSGPLRVGADGAFGTAEPVELPFRP